MSYINAQIIILPLLSLCLFLFVAPVPLPDVHLNYYILPSSERNEGNAAIKALLSSSFGRRLVFVKAVTLIVTVPPRHNKLVHYVVDTQGTCNSCTGMVCVVSCVCTSEGVYVLPKFRGHSPTLFYIEMKECIK